MAVPRLVTIRDFNTSVYAQLADTSTANISDVLASAEQAIERKVGRPLAPTTFTEYFTPQSNKLYLKHRPVISVTSITRAYVQGAVPTNVTSFVVNNAEGTILSATPLIGYFVTVVYTAGFTETPADIKQAILMQAAMFAFQDLEFYGSGDAKAPGILYVEDQINALLKPYQQLNLAFTPSWS